MKKRIISLILVLAICAGFVVMPTAVAQTPTAAAQPDGISVTIDGERVHFPGQQPVIIDGRTLVPVRGVFEQLGFEVNWFSQNNPQSDGSTIMSWQVTIRNAYYTLALFGSDSPMGRVPFVDVSNPDGYSAIAIGQNWVAQLGLFASTDPRIYSLDPSRYEIVWTDRVQLDVPPQIIGGSTMLPIRALAESVGYYVNWDGATQTVMIRSTPFDGQTVMPGDGDGFITIRGQRFCMSLTRLDLTEFDLANADIKPLRYMTNLSILNLSNSGITDISPIANLTNLVNLQLNNTHVRDLTPLARLTNLRTLSIRNNLWLGDNLTSENLVPLAGLVNLTMLDLRDNEICELMSLTNLTNLYSLSLSWNHISDLTPIANLINLSNLILRFNQITDISPLAELTTLRILELDHNQIADLYPLSGLTNLQLLSLGSNQISDIRSLTALTSLYTLFLPHNQVADLRPLSGLTNLRGLDLWGNPITDIIPLAGLTNLQWINLGGALITNWSPVAHVEDVRGRP